MDIPFNEINLIGNELKYMREAVKCSHLSGDGRFSHLCEHALESSTHARRAFLTSSGTHALELAALVGGIGPGDEVVMPSFTFPSTANAFALRGARPRFVDIRSDTLNIDENRIEEAINRKTRAICVVHYAGVPCEMEALTRIARRHRLLLVEDAAQAFTASYRGRAAGTFGAFGAISFHETKNVFCGEGGALLVNHDRYIRGVEIARQKGTNRAAFFRGEVDKYNWVALGSSYLPSELQAAFLFGQLEKIRFIEKRRKHIYERYLTSLRPLETAGKIILPVIPSGCVSSYHLFHVLVDREKTRDHVLHQLKKQSIYAIFHYQPLHLSPMGRNLGYRKGALPVTERAGECLIRLPFFNAITDDAIDRVSQALHRSLA